MARSGRGTRFGAGGSALFGPNFGNADVELADRIVLELSYAGIWVTAV